MKARSYGSWEAEDLVLTLNSMGPTWDASKENIEDDATLLKQEGHYDSFIESFRELLLDESLDFRDKATLYLDVDFWSPRQSWDYFQYLWELLAPEEKFPLDDSTRPEESKSKDHQFRPR